MKLPDCHSRRTMDGESGVFFCAHPKVHAPRSLVRAEICKLCRFWQEPAPERFRPFSADGHAGPCIYLRQEAGLRDCPTCRGSVRQKLFACGHPLHKQTTLRDCQRCADFEPQLTSGRVKSWAVGVTTAPREEPTLARCLASLAAAGWDEPVVFAEPQAQVPERFHRLDIVRRAAPLGVVGNWLLALSELVIRQPEADAYVMVQDDAVFCRSVRPYLERTLWPAERVGLVSVYRPALYAAEKGGFAPVELAHPLAAALTHIFPPAAARQAVASGAAMAQRWRAYHEGQRRLDWLVGRLLRCLGLAAYYHAPSLAQHIGETSTVWPKAAVRGRRRASDFVGEAFDATALPQPPPRERDKADSTDVQDT